MEAKIESVRTQHQGDGKCTDVVDLPPHFLNQLKGGTGLLKIGFPADGGSAASVSAVGGASRSASLEIRVRNSFNPCGGQDPGSTPYNGRK